MEFIFNLGAQVTAAGDVGSYYTQAGFLVMGNGDGERNTLPGVRDELLVTTVRELRAAAMEMERHQRLLRGTLRIHRVTTQLGWLRQWRMQKDL